MKSSIVVLVFAAVSLGWTTSLAQALEQEVPGDNFSLEGTLELFKKSASPEEFERLLNSPDSKVNNLDLNGDGYIDYIRVIDRYEGNIHVFVLQAVISERESQDVAVIELEKLANGKAVLQIVGDADIYGIETIIEPTTEVRTYAGTQTSRTVVNVWAWPSVQYVYGPYYSAWTSPWGWHMHPVWWHRWRPVAYVYYYPIWQPYRHYYDYCYTPRIIHAHRIYSPYRVTSVIVRDRHHDRIVRYRSNYDDRTHARRYSRSSSGSEDRGRENREGDRISADRTQTVSTNRSSRSDRMETLADRSSDREGSQNLQRVRQSVPDKDVNARVRTREEAAVQRRDIPKNTPKLNRSTNSSSESRKPVVRSTSSRPSSDRPVVQQRSAPRERSAPARVESTRGAGNKMTRPTPSGGSKVSSSPRGNQKLSPDGGRSKGRRGN